MGMRGSAQLRRLHRHGRAGRLTRASGLTLRVLFLQTDHEADGHTEPYASVTVSKPLTRCRHLCKSLWKSDDEHFSQVTIAADMNIVRHSNF